MGLMDLFGSYSKRELRKLNPIVNKIIALEDSYKALTDEQLKAKTPEFKERLQKGETLDDILPEAFATVREAADRVLGMRPFVCQLIGGIVLHQGRIAEMKTGEGKTMVATLPTYLNALSGKGVHIVTVNDYLARRDSEWMGKVHTFLGLRVGLIVHGLTNAERREAYAADITYGTNNEFGFDYLRDNMVVYKQDMVQRGHNFAIVDEVDSILIDEARTPLIISGHGEKSDDMYKRADAFVRKLKCLRVKELDSKEIHDDADADYIVEEKNKTSVLTARGIDKAQREFGVENLADQENVELQHYINQSLKAYGTMQRDIDYVVKEGQVIIVDEFTGRLMFGRRYSNGLHQAIEAKEKVDIENESKTLATITFQNYFRIFDKLAGMTGTALTEEAEFSQIYGLDVLEIPTNKPMIRVDHNDVIYKTEHGKFNAIVEMVREHHEKGQPILIGTVTIEKSELLSSYLTKNGIPHNVLNAKYHEKEAAIIAQAGRKGAVTIATNMAGRGTDIILGGNAEYMAKQDMEKEGFSHELIVQATSFAETSDEEILRAKARYRELYAMHKVTVDAEAAEVREAGGLCIIGTERHESRRIDNQLRGRAGRQGDIGESYFYMSLQDDLLRLFGGERITSMMEMFNLPEDQPIDAKMISNTIESAQKKVEGQNFSRRKRVLEYDDVINEQRKLIYAQRNQVLNGEDLQPSILKMIRDVVETGVARNCVGDDPMLWSLDELQREFAFFVPATDLTFEDAERAKLSRKDLQALLQQRADEAYARSEAENTSERMREIERVVLLKTVDKYWMDHIDAMDELKQSIGLLSYGNRDPVRAYKMEGSDMFDEMIAAIKFDTVKGVMLLRVVRQEIKREQVAKVDETSLGGEPQKKKPVVKKASEKVGRNDPCPCGSGLKYKKCCGKDE